MVTNTRGSYLFTPDEGKMLSDVYSAPLTKLHSGDGHKHGKPIEWLAALIGNTIRPGDVVLDPFAGGGASLAACRLLGVNWIGGDISEQCVNKIIEDDSAGQGASKSVQLNLI